MKTDREKLQRFANLAARVFDNACSIEEKRTCAVIAMRMLQETGIIANIAQSLTAPAPVAPQATPGPPPDPRRRIIRAKFETRCTECRRMVAKGAKIAWLKGAPPICHHCHGGSWS